MSDNKQKLLDLERCNNNIKEQLEKLYPSKNFVVQHH